MKPKNTKLILIPAVIVVFFLVSQTFEIVQTFLKVDILRNDLINLTNQNRTEQSLDPLNSNELLDLAAQAKAEDMAAKSYFSHTSPDGKKFYNWIEDQNYDYLYAGENLAVKFSDSAALTKAWMNSEKHRDNILGMNFTDIGIGIAEGIYQGKKTIFVVELFGQLKISPALINHYKINTVATGNWTDINSSQNFLAVENEFIDYSYLLKPEKLGPLVIEFLPI